MQAGTASGWVGSCTEGAQTGADDLVQDRRGGGPLRLVEDGPAGFNL